MAGGDVTLDEAAIYDLLNGPGGPVTQLLEEISVLGATKARAAARIRKAVWDIPAPENTAFPPGYTEASIRTNVHYYNGLIYGGVAAVEFPTLFLEDPAEQMESRYPFLSTAFDGVQI